jgi:hypothetical protein
MVEGTSNTTANLGKTINISRSSRHVVYMSTINLYRTTCFKDSQIFFVLQFFLVDNFIVFGVHVD